jgi:hypothetical protein
MIGDAVQAWLAGRGPAAPPGLAARLEDAAAMPGAPGIEGALADRLARLGLALLNRVAGAPAGGRELAADLLAADAMVTYAFEAQAEADVSGLEGLADWVAREERGERGGAADA